MACRQVLDGDMGTADSQHVFCLCHGTSPAGLILPPHHRSCQVQQAIRHHKALPPVDYIDDLTDKGRGVAIGLLVWLLAGHLVALLTEVGVEESVNKR